MGLDREEEIIILYALHRCGGKGSKARIIHFITENGLLKPREGDTELRQTRETRIENDLAWSRANLKEKRQLSMPKNGVWQIADLGRQRLFRVAGNIHAKKPDPDWFHRYNEKFIAEMAELGGELSKTTPAAS
jgi:restriction endonuclease Mrr